MVDFDNSIFKKLCVVSAPSGAGKTSLIKKILKDKNISVCISDTSRKPRVGEANGIDYNFISSDEFQDKIKNETKATIRCIPLDENPDGTLCIYSGKPAQHQVIFAKAY